MASTITFNPLITTNGIGSFNTQSDGYIQGTALNDPSVRNYLAGGVLASTETLPMWGGVGISEIIDNQATSPINQVGNTIIRATALTGASALTGFSTFDQAYGMVNTPQSPVPLVGSYGQVNFYRLGSGARIAVKADPNLVSMEGAIITANVSWDFVNQQLVPYVSTTISSGTYTTGTGAVSLTTAAAHGLLPGDTFVISGMTGTGSYANLNGSWTAVAGTTGTTLNFVAATGLTMTITGGTISNGGALNVKVIDFSIGNSMTVNYNSTTGFATWNYSGSTAIILI